MIVARFYVVQQYIKTIYPGVEAQWPLPSTHFPQGPSEANSSGFISIESEAALDKHPKKRGVSG